MTNALEGLDKINWSNLKHAYGPANDVPILLKTLVEGDKKQREKVWYEFFGNIWHQGTIYEATVFATPFFVKLVQKGPHHDLASILDFLSVLADGTSYLDVHQDIICSEEERMSNEHQDQLKKELSWGAAVKTAILVGLDDYKSCLDHSDEKVREFAQELILKLE